MWKISPYNLQNTSNLSLTGSHNVQLTARVSHPVTTHCKTFSLYSSEPPFQKIQNKIKIIFAKFHSNFSHPPSMEIDPILHPVLQRRDTWRRHLHAHRPSRDHTSPPPPPHCSSILESSPSSSWMTILLPKRCPS